MSISYDLLDNIDKLHTTELGVMRIKKNLSLDTDMVVDWCRDKIISSNATIIREGKNWYINGKRFNIGRVFKLPFLLYNSIK